MPSCWVYGIGRGAIAPDCIIGGWKENIIFLKKVSESACNRERVGLCFKQVEGIGPSVGKGRYSMKTRNIFVIDGSMVKAQIVTGTGEEMNVLCEKWFDAAAIPELLTDGDGQKDLKAYGLASLLQDRAASYNDKALAEMGATYTARADRYQEVYDMLVSGVFSERKKGGGAASGVDAFFAQGFQAFLAANGKDVDVTVATSLLQGMSKDERAALRKHPKIAPLIAEAKAKANEAAAGIDLADLLG